MKELELKHLSPYLPYGLAVRGEKGMYTLTGLSPRIRVAYLENHKSTNGGSKMWLLDVNHWRNVEQGYNPQIFKPILRPLSDLNKSDLDYIYFEIISTDSDMFGSRYEFEDFFNETNLEYLPVCIYDYLLEHHFDVFDLISNNLAIDINTLEK